MGIAFLGQRLHRFVEGEPLADASRKFAFLFQFFEDLEGLPSRRIVLARGHAVLSQIGEREFESLTALLMIRLGHDCKHRPLRRLAQNAGRLSALVAVDVSALWIAGGKIDAA